MELKDARARLYEIFPSLVIEDGLSVYEGMAYGLSHELGYTRSETAEIMTFLTGKNVTPQAVSKYVQTARTKMSAKILAAEGRV